MIARLATAFGLILGASIALSACVDGKGAAGASGDLLRADECAHLASPLSLSTAVTCASVGGAGNTLNPCDPGCRIFEEEPAPALMADDAHPWETGRVSLLPADERALRGSECETGADCQFNSYCSDPSLGTCEHSVCEAGDGLRDGCSECASQVCLTDPSCCDVEANVTSCAHDPCAPGTPLDAGCDSCAASICGTAGLEHCCEDDGQWDQLCVDAVAGVCGNTCGCATDEIDVAGRCYKIASGERTWESALVDCRTRGADWDLVSLSDASENSVVFDWAEGGDHWVGFFDAGSSASGPSGVTFARASAEKPGNGPGFALDGSSSTSWTVESPLLSSPRITASESQSGHPPADALDGDNGTYWAAESADNTDGKELTVFLDTPVLLEDVEIRWKNAHSRTFDFEILAGADEGSLATVWPRGDSTLLGSPGTESYDVADGTVSVVRVVAYGNSGSGWNSIDELSLVSTPSVTPTSSVLPEWIEMVLPTSQTVESVDLEWDNDDAQFEIWVGDDSASLTQLYSGTNGTDQSLVNYDVADTVGRLVRIRAFGNASSRWNNLERFLVRTTGVASGSWRWASSDPSTTWSEGTGTGGYENWTSSWSSAPDASLDCAVLRGSDGEWEGRSCAETHGYVCEGPPRFMGASPGDWTEGCADLAEDLCHVQCAPGASGSAAGACVSWSPGERDAACTGPDLAVGVPCDGVLPICNHGSATAPSGIEVVHFPRSAGFFGTSSPDTSHPDAVSCTTAEPIPAGECISLSGCVLPSHALRDVVVNPDSAVAECSPVDNWAVYDETVSCGEPYCGGSTTASQQPKVDIVFIVDNSSSMEDEIDEIESLLAGDFASIIENSGLDYRVIMISRFARDGEQVAGSYFPICIGPPLGNDACTDSSVPFALVPPFYPYSNDTESEDAWCDVLKTFTQSDEFAPADEVRPWTPLSPGGWSQWLREDAQKSFVVITDDEVKCSTETSSFRDLNSVSASTGAAAAFDAELLALAPQQFGTTSDRKYTWHSIVGMDAPASGLAPSDPIETSRCGGSADAPGTGHQALSRLTGGLRYPICDTNNFDVIFNRLAEAVVDSSETQCEYDVPAIGSFDPVSSTVSVSLTDSGTGVESQGSLTQVADLASCVADAFYFDDPSAPTSLILCPTTCSGLQPTSGQVVEVFVELGCTPPSTATFTEIYEADCERGQHPFWTFVTYDADIPVDASVSFSVRSGMDATELASASFALGRTADSSQPVCGLGCGVSLDTVLSPEEWSDDFLELQIELVPNSSGTSPVLDDWEVWYSCQDRE